jgi:hypothetical protein
MRPPRTLTLPAVVGLALVLTACAHGAEPQPAQTPAVTPAGSAAAGDLQAALLTTADMPPGFVVTQDTGDAQKSGGCPPLEADVESGARTHAQVLFKADDLGPFIRERLLELSPEDAQKVVTNLRSAVDACRHFTSHDDTVGSIEFSVSMLSVDPMGDATAAIRLTGRPTIVDLALYQDIVAIRHGDVVILISHVSMSSIDVSLTRSTAEKALRKLQSRR